MLYCGGFENRCFPLSLLERPNNGFQTELSIEGIEIQSKISRAGK